MAKFNKKDNSGEQIENHPDRIKEGNYEGGTAFEMGDELKLYTQVCSCLVGEPKFYGNVLVQHSDLVQLIRKVAAQDPAYVAKLAVYVRHKMNLRSIAVMLLVELANTSSAKDSGLIRRTTPQVVSRADELTEVMAYQFNIFGRTKINNGLRRGLADAFTKFDAYQLAKYDRKGEVKLKDVLKMVRPKPTTEEQSKLWKMLKEDNLPIPDTWEVVISTKGSTKENWEAIIPKMGTMAKLRNLRNFLEKGCDISVVMKELEDPEVIRKSKQLPFRFFSAYKAVEEVDGSFDCPEVLEALSNALELSITNVPTFDGNTVVAVDLSESMTSYLSSRSSVSYKDVASVMGAIAVKRNPNNIIYGFGQIIAQIPLNKGSSVMDIIQKIGDTDVGHSTNGYLVLQDMITKKIKADRIMLFSDMQLYSDTGFWERHDSFATLWKKYKKSINPKAKLYSFDLAGYGQSTIPQDEKGTYLLAGWSEKVFDFVRAMEEDPAIAVKTIKEMDLNVRQK